MLGDQIGININNDKTGLESNNKLPTFIGRMIIGRMHMEKMNTNTAH